MAGGSLPSRVRNRTTHPQQLVTNCPVDWAVATARHGVALRVQPHLDAVKQRAQSLTSIQQRHRRHVNCQAGTSQATSVNDQLSMSRPHASCNQGCCRAAVGDYMSNSSHRAFHQPLCRRRRGACQVLLYGTQDGSTLAAVLPSPPGCCPCAGQGGVRGDIAEEHLISLNQHRLKEPSHTCLSCCQGCIMQPILCAVCFIQHNCCCNCTCGVLHSAQLPLQL
jgi:hypothetical protein